LKNPDNILGELQMVVKHETCKGKPQKPTPRLRKLLVRAHRIFEKEYPDTDVAIKYLFFKSEDVQRLGREFGKNRRCAMSIYGRHEHIVIFDIDLDKMPDDFILFNFLHEFIHAGFEETDEAKAISMTFDVMKGLGVDRDDFMRRYRHWLV